MSEPILLKSGHVFVPAPPDWAAAKKLFKTVARELKTVEIDLGGMDVKTLQGLDAGVFVKAFLQVAGSDAIETAVMECATRCLLNDNKVTPALFEQSADMRRDYLPVAWEVLKISLLPFFEDLLSALPTPSKGKAISP